MGSGIHPKRLLFLANRARQAAGLPPLAWSERLALAAERHARDMVERKFYSHFSPDGLSPSDRASAAIGSTSAAARPTRDIWVSLGLGVAAVSAAFSSFDGLKSLAEAAGWSDYMAPLFALCIDAYALAAIRVWLARSTSTRAASFARKNAAGAVALSLLGNAAWHLIDAGLLAVTWPVVLGVGSVPPVILGLVTHLSILRKQGGGPVPKDGAPVPGEGLKELPVPQPGRRALSGDELLDAARIADAEFRERYGQSITRDLLRTTLGVGGQKATELLRRLRADEPPAVPSPKTVTAKCEKP